MATEKNPRRLHDRIATAIRVDWGVDGSALRCVSETRDLGQGGVYVVTAVERPPLEAPVRLRFLTNVGAISVRGRVVRVDDDGFGIVFDEAP